MNTKLEFKNNSNLPKIQSQMNLPYRDKPESFGAWKLSEKTVVIDEGLFPFLPLIWTISRSY